MSTFEIAIASALIGILVLWFGIYLWRSAQWRMPSKDQQTLAVKPP
jgi:hypothetical protein